MPWMPASAARAAGDRHREGEVAVGGEQTGAVGSTQLRGALGHAPAAPRASAAWSSPGGACGSRRPSRCPGRRGRTTSTGPRARRAAAKPGAMPLGQQALAARSPPAEPTPSQKASPGPSFSGLTRPMLPPSSSRPAQHGHGRARSIPVIAPAAPSEWRRRERHLAAGEHRRRPSSRSRGPALEHARRRARRCAAARTSRSHSTGGPAWSTIRPSRPGIRSPAPAGADQHRPGRLQALDRGSRLAASTRSSP